MTKKRKEERLADLSYLWTSGEWTLHCFHYSRARVIFVFPPGRPSLQELLAVRALVPRFSDSPMSLLKEEVGRVSEFDAGDFGSSEARQFETRARARGLTVRIEDASGKEYIRVSVNGDKTLMIEDNELACLVTEEMLRRGVPVVSHHEID
jgi:hypothetical protein